ncbi:MAG: molybdopterin-dependent oxidoreductase [Candidatus Devosia symbiotica]|nr:molybdopterin-dependent oxidoreductase [Candidatus Devosia symbiotica]
MFCAEPGSGLVLADCDQFDFLESKDNQVRWVIEQANVLTYRAQRALIGDQALAHKYAASEIRQGQRPNRSTDPTTPEYMFLKGQDFASRKLKITSMVERPLEFTLDELRNMPSRSQITRHDCVEGWSCIAKWTGTQLGPLLNMARVKSGVQFCVYIYCFDNIQRTLSGDILYYESSDLVDADRPQTLLSYGLNNKILLVRNGAPVRLRIEWAWGYKQPKYLHTIEPVDDLSSFGKGKSGYWPDFGYD